MSSVLTALEVAGAEQIDAGHLGVWWSHRTCSSQCRTRPDGLAQTFAMFEQWRNQAIRHAAMVRRTRPPGKCAGSVSVCSVSPTDQNAAGRVHGRRDFAASSVLGGCQPPSPPRSAAICRPAETCTRPRTSELTRDQRLGLRLHAELRCLASSVPAASCRRARQAGAP